MKILSSIVLLFSLVFSASAFGFGPQMVKKEFKCSLGSDYAVYIEQISGITVSYSLKAFCLKDNDAGLAACTSDEEADTYTCYEEFNSLNELRAGDGALEIVNGRE